MGVNDERLLTPREVAEYLQVPGSTLSQWRYLGRGPAWVKLGRHVRYAVADLNDYVAAQRVSTTDGSSRSGVSRSNYGTKRLN